MIDTWQCHKVAPTLKTDRPKLYISKGAAAMWTYRFPIEPNNSIYSAERTEQHVVIGLGELAAVD